MFFDSREEAGRLLGEELKRRGVVADRVFGLARGGVVVANTVARLLNTQLVPLIVRKIGAPGHEEFALGALAEIPGTNRTIVQWDQRVLNMVHATEEWKEENVREKEREMEKYKKELSKNGKNGLDDVNHCLIVDDGAATGATMLAAVTAVRHAFPDATVTVALPVASSGAAEQFRNTADHVVILHEDPVLSAVGQFYAHFPQVEWEEVRKLL